MSYEVWWTWTAQHTALMNDSEGLSDVRALARVHAARCAALVAVLTLDAQHTALMND